MATEIDIRGWKEAALNDYLHRSNFWSGKLDGRELTLIAEQAQEFISKPNTKCCISYILDYPHYCSDLGHARVRYA